MKPKTTVVTRLEVYDSSRHTTFKHAENQGAVYTRELNQSVTDLESVIIAVVEAVCHCTDNNVALRVVETTTTTTITTTTKDLV